MKSFRFNLARVLEFQAAQLQTEEVKLRGVNLEITALQNSAAALEQSRITAEADVHRAPRIDGSDLHSFEAYRHHVEKQKANLRTRLIETQKRLDEQRERLLVVRRKHRLLEKLRERRLQEWTMESNRESEQTASESHLARFVREQ